MPYVGDEVRAMSQSERQSKWLLTLADTLAFCVFLASWVVVAHDGLSSGALIIGIPPFVVAVLASVGISAASHWKRRWPALVSIAVCVLAVGTAAVSFIVPLVLVVFPVGGLLIAAAALRLDAAPVAQLAVYGAPAHATGPPKDSRS
jgi:hypothetical protein